MTAQTREQKRTADGSETASVRSVTSSSAKSNTGSTSGTTAATAAVGKRQTKSLAALEVGSIKFFFSKGSEQGDAGPKMP